MNRLLAFLAVLTAFAGLASIAVLGAGAGERSRTLIVRAGDMFVSLGTQTSVAVSSRTTESRLSTAAGPVR